jgi:hypothetical protein
MIKQEDLTKEELQLQKELEEDYIKIQNGTIKFYSREEMDKILRKDLAKIKAEYKKKGRLMGVKPSYAV